MPALCGAQHAGSLRAARPLSLPLLFVRCFSALPFARPGSCAPQRRDTLFGRQRRQALLACWDRGLKVAPRANPG